MGSTHEQEIYLAGGCFWGVEAYFQKVDGVIATTSGYANGTKENPSYEEVCTGRYGFTETVRVVFNEQQVTLEQILMHYLRIIDPYAVNKQGNDRGVQYRTGIYYKTEELGHAVKELVQQVPDAINFNIEIEPLKNFYAAENDHQDYLMKNPLGYCHVNLAQADEPLPKTIAAIYNA